MMTSAEARLAINARIKSFIGINQDYIQWSNQADFEPPVDDMWCRVTIQYSPTITSGIHFGLLERDLGIISIQCFAPKGCGDKDLTELADKWRDHFKGYVISYLEITQTNAPTDIYTEVSTNYVSTLVRIQFRIN